MQRLQSYPGKAFSLLCLNGHGLQRVFYITHATRRVRKLIKGSVRAPWTTERESKYVLGCACQRKAAA